MGPTADMRWAAAFLLAILLLAALPAAQAQETGSRILVKRLLFNALAPVDQVGASTETPLVFNYTGPARPQPTRLVWDLGDGSNLSLVRPAGQAFAQTSFDQLHAYAQPGSYTVRVRVLEGDQEIDNLSTSLLVEAPPTNPPLRSAFYWAMPTVAGVILISLSFLVLGRGQPVVYNRVFFLLYVTSGIKSLAEAGLALTTEGRLASLYTLFSSAHTISGYFLITLFLWFVFVFPRPVFPWLKDGSRGAVFLLLAVPFVLNYLFPVIPTGVVATYFNLYVSLAALLALGVLVYHAWETDSEEERNRIRLLSASFFLLVFSTIVTAGLQVLAKGAPTTYESLYYLGWNLVFALAVAPALEILGSMILMYAILRYQLLGIEVFVRRVTRATLFALMIGSTFVIVSNTVEEIVQNAFLGDVPLAFIIAGFISTMAMYPVQKITERFANKAFPQAGSDAPDYMAKRRMEIYEAQLRYALLDGRLKQKELTMLNALRDSLGIRLEELRRVASLFPGLDPRALMPLGTMAAAPGRPPGVPSTRSPPAPSPGAKARRSPPRP